MAGTIEYYLSLNSPWSYLGGRRLRALAREAGAEVRVMPVKLGEVFQRTGGVPLPQRAPERRAYRLAELRRWSAFLGIPIVLEPKHFPADETRAAQAAIAADATGRDALSFSIAVGEALWGRDENIGDAEVVAAGARSVGIDLDDLMGEPAFADAAAVHTRNTETAIAKGVFGVPTYVYGGELLWGQDRLDFLARALAA